MRFPCSAFVLWAVSSVGSPGLAGSKCSRGSASTMHGAHPVAETTPAADLYHAIHRVSPHTVRVVDCAGGAHLDQLTGSSWPAVAAWTPSDTPYDSRRVASSVVVGDPLWCPVRHR